MPELPEVETIVRDLNKKIKGKVIKSVQVRVPKLVKNLNTKFVQALLGQKVGSVTRRAKLIKVKIGQQKTLLIHLKLTGQLIYREKSGKLTAGGHPIPQDLKDLPNKFTHIIFTFTDESHLFYNDLRKFGWMNLVSESAAEKLPNQEFGPEPLSPEFTLEKFKQVLAKKSGQPLKKVLMEQKNIAGIGNIYTDEVCFYAGVKPTRQVKSLKPQETERLWQGTRHILKSAIKHRGTSVDTYVDISGRQGGYIPYLKVYDRVGQKCKRQNCHGVVKKIKFNGRGTHYCDQCQR